MKATKSEKKKKRNRTLVDMNVINPIIKLKCRIIPKHEPGAKVLIGKSDMRKKKTDRKS